jgi:dTDP-4-amino-4,6-dideoxygalactose transaminase
VIHGDGSQIRSWCYVDDMVAGTLACLEHPDAVGQAFNIGNPRATVTIYDLALRIKRLTGADVDITFQPLHYADVELRIPNVEKAREVLGFAAKVDLDEGPREDDRVVSRENAERVRLAFPELGEAELEAVREVFESGALTMGPKVQEFEELVADACGVEHAVAVSNGTAALHLAVLALGIGEGDEVLVPAYTFPATASVVRLAGATPVLVDIDPATFNLDPGAVYDSVTPRTKAVLAVHLFGRPLDWEALQNAVPPEVLLIEDAAGALGARWRGMPCGGLGTMGCLSFHPRKIVTTGEGGAVTTQDADLAASIRRLRNHGLDAVPTSLQPSTNYRLADILCAIGIPQLRRLDELLAERTRIAEGYSERLAGAVDVPDADEGDIHGWQAYVIRLDRKDEALETLRAEGIEVQIGTYALQRLSAYRDQGSFPGADAAFDRALALPLHSRLTDDDLDRVAAGILRFA